MTTEKHCEFVSSRGIALYCQHYPKIIKSDINQLDTKDYQNIQNGDKVYVISSALNKFIEQIFSNLEPEYGKKFGVYEIIRLIERKPEILNINKHCIEKDPRG